MAKQKKTTAKSSTKSEDSNVIRISASEKPAKKPAKSAAVTKKSVKTTVPREQKSGRRNPVSALLEYFKGAWTELRLVRWPTRKATWGLTLAVLLFSAFFVVFILLVDTGFKFLFDTIYKQ